MNNICLQATIVYIEWFSDGVDLKSDRGEGFLVEQVAAIKNESRFVHALEDKVPIKASEFLPLGKNDDCVGSISRIKSGTLKSNVFGNKLGNLFGVHSWIMNMNAGALSKQIQRDRDCGRFAKVCCDAKRKSFVYYLAFASKKRT